LHRSSLTSGFFAGGGGLTFGRGVGEELLELVEKIGSSVEEGGNLSVNLWRNG
jgi:hypothetical protein